MEFDQRLIVKLRQAEHIVVFTGAGVSQESGVPTFRDELTGLWEKYDPSELATVEAFKKNRDVVWGWYEHRRTSLLKCSPNLAHLAIATMANHVPQVTVITQNVDDLHERAGSQEVLHLHGSLFQPRCHACARNYNLPTEIHDIPLEGQSQMPPKCNHCGGWIRPGVVWFGEALPEQPWRQAIKAIKSCDVLFSIGTSSVVYPAASLPFEATKRGAFVIQVNPTATDLDEVASSNLKGKAGEIMSELIKATWT